MTRCYLLLSIAILLSPTSAEFQTAAAAPPVATTHGPKSMTVYIGTYTRGDGKGIHIYRLDMKTGQLAPSGGVSGIRNPSFQALHPNGKFLYSVSMSRKLKGKRSGTISAFAIDPATGNLRLLNEQPSIGAGPCHVAVDRDGTHVLAANYSGGSVVVLPIRPDGSLDKASDFVQHEGSSVHARQKGPHAHGIYVDANNRFAFCPDLGLDKLLIYRYDSKRGKLTPNPDMPAATLKPGAGPRHFAFHPSGRFGYVINEINSTITAFRYDAKRGVLTTLQSVSTLPPGFVGENTTAEIAVSPDGRFVYGSNRGDDSIVVFATDGATGKLTYVSHHKTLGKTPRNFAIAPTGTLLLAANQATNNVVVFRIDRQTGKLTPAGAQVDVPAPVCITMQP